MSRDSADATGVGTDFDRDVGSGSAEDRAALRRIDRVSTVLDESIPVPGTNFRFGLDPVLGLVPGGGDLVAAIASLYIVAEGYRAGVSTRGLLKMLALVAVDVVVGSVPVVGPLFDAVWKANVWNARIVEEALVEEESNRVPVV
ncbi:DUF4112 domain-containing protein [Haloarchaeobius sp. HRN-SO-5]|uniref:DUF4112 domain-containing protein n=1 Tax=Haloarchaeobius sp. HRN-SO-5 TaxID=3446118 RepID=UPI003EBB9D76